MMSNHRRQIFVIITVTVTLAGCVYFDLYGAARGHILAYRRKTIPATFVAHAFGGLDDTRYLNCRECFLANYEKGFRYFEVDFMSTSDGHFVAMHDGHEGRYGLEKMFTLREFQQSKIRGKTPVDMPTLVALMQTYPDWYLITDVKTDNAAGLRFIASALKNAGIDPRQRVIPQLYFLKEFAFAHAIGFDRMILTLYRMGLRDKNGIIKFVRDHPEISAVTMRYRWLDDSFRDALRRYRVQIFVHTYNDADEINRILQAGIDGIYTDYYFR
jgi:glycerophosphoryl diester phosphodiesterase